MKSCVTLSLVSSLKGGPWILWDDLEKGIKEASELGFECIELFTAGPSAGKANELNKFYQIIIFLLVQLVREPVKCLMVYTDSSEQENSPSSDFIYH